MTEARALESGEFQEKYNIDEILSLISKGMVEKDVRLRGDFKINIL